MQYIHRYAPSYVVLYTAYYFTVFWGKVNRQNTEKNDLVTHNEFLTTNKKWEHPTANRKLPSLEKYYFILLISKGLYIKTSLRVIALEISIYSKNETGQNSITLPEWQVMVRELLFQSIAWIVGFGLVETGLVRIFIISPLSSAQ